MDFKENQRCIAEKDTSFGVLHTVQKRPRYENFGLQEENVYVAHFEFYRLCHDSHLVRGIGFQFLSESDRNRNHRRDRLNWKHYFVAA